MATIDDVYNLLLAVEVKVDAIQAKTDLLTFTGTDVIATLDGETVSVSPTSGGVTLSAERFEDFPETEY